MYLPCLCPVLFQCGRNLAQNHPGSCNEWQTQHWQAHEMIFFMWLPSLRKYSIFPGASLGEVKSVTFLHQILFLPSQQYFQWLAILRGTAALRWGSPSSLLSSLSSSLTPGPPVLSGQIWALTMVRVETRHWIVESVTVNFGNEKGTSLLPLSSLFLNANNPGRTSWVVIGRLFLTAKV